MVPVWVCFLLKEGLLVNCVVVSHDWRSFVVGLGLMAETEQILIMCIVCRVQAANSAVRVCAM